MGYNKGFTQVQTHHDVTNWFELYCSEDLSLALWLSLS